MRKLDNKGLSLVELLIAIAVMALLLSPIMLQLIQSVQLSGEAKERQYVIDSANEIMEYVRKYDKAELASPTDLEGLVSVTSVYDSAKVRETNPTDSSLPKTVYLYLADGTSVGYVPGSDWDYIKYNLDDESLGKQNQAYGRYVVQSNLIYEIGERGYEVDYDQVAGSGTVDSSLTTAGFEFRSDNSVVLCAGSDKYDDSQITGIVVKKKTALVAGDYDVLKNPNDTSIGDIQDIDSDKMAIIPGDATTLDYQVLEDIKTAIIQFAAYDVATDTYPTTDVNHPRRGQALHTILSDAPFDDPKYLNDYITELLANPANVDLTRNIHVTITAGKDEAGTPVLKTTTNGTIPKFYQVRCDVIYRAKFSTSSGDFNALNLYCNDDGYDYCSNTGYFKYTVLNRKYYTNVPPNIYMVYEPLVTQTATGAGSEPNISYAQNDYITVSTDKYTAGLINESTGEQILPPSKMYLIRSTDNWQKVTGKTAVDDGTGAYYTTLPGGGSQLVNIHVRQAKIGATNSDNLYIDGNQKLIDIYTNIGLNYSTTKNETALYGTDHQFKTNGSLSRFPGFKTDDVSEEQFLDSDLLSERSNQNDRKYEGLAASSGSDTDTPDIYRYEHIKSVYDEEPSTDGRLFKVTVVYTNKSTNEETYITGAKGAN